MLSRENTIEFVRSRIFSQGGEDVPALGHGCLSSRVARSGASKDGKAVRQQQQQRAWAQGALASGSRADPDGAPPGVLTVFAIRRS